MDGSNSTNVRVTDIANPELLPNQVDALSYADANPIELSVDAVLGAARAESGLSEVGASDFIDRLEVQVRAVRADTGLSNFGKLAVFGEWVRFARNRLQIEDLISRHPEIEQLELAPPVLIAGLPRSGTTFLHQIIAADGRLRSTPYYEALYPVAAPYSVDGVDTRRSLAQARWEATDKISPYTKMIHAFTPDHICEDVELTDIDAGSYYLEWLADVPAWRDYQASHDMRSTYRYMHRVLQALSWQSGGPRHWVTKCPQHMERLGPLNDVFPGAAFLVTHRDPVASIQSAITALAIAARITRKQVSTGEIADYWIDRYERLLRGCVEQRDMLDDAKSLDIYFHELMADPEAVIAQAYDKIGLPFDGEARASIADALTENQRGRHGQLIYDLRDDFGLEPAAIRERFQFYFDRFPNVAVEVE